MELGLVFQTGLDPHIGATPAIISLIRIPIRWVWTARMSGSTLGASTIATSRPCASARSHPARGD